MLSLKYILLVNYFAMVANSQLILRYTKNSCANMEPVFVEESYSGLNLGPPKDNFKDDGESQVFQAPKKLSSRNPPFEIDIDFDKYSSNREYKIKLLAYDQFDSFMLQVRGRPQNDGNATYVGMWTKLPGIAKTIRCLNEYRAAVVDKGRPIKLGNLTFTWKAPSKDMGKIRILASIGFDDVYVPITTREIGYHTFPISMEGCKSRMSCYRFCHTHPLCPPQETSYMVTIKVVNVDTPQPEVDFKMGGYLKTDQSNYVALGLGNDVSRLRNMDLAVCYRKGDQVMLNHYLVEDSTTKPFEHRARLRMTDSGIDYETGYAWCAFRRPMRPEAVYDLDLADKMYHFYFWGQRNNDSSLLLPSPSQIYKSSYRLNITEPYSEVGFTGGSGGRSASTVHHLSTTFMIVFTTILLTFAQ